MFDGDTVSYVGPSRDGLELGDRGEVLRAQTGGSHLVMKTGKRVSEIVFVPNDDLVSVASPRRQASVWDDSLSDGTIVTVAVADLYETDGASGLINALHEDGYLSALYVHAEESIESLARAIRADAVMHEVLAQLDPDEAEHFVTITTRALIREACRGA